MLLLSKKRDEKDRLLKTQILMSTINSLEKLKNMRKHGPKVVFLEMKKINLPFLKKIFWKMLWSRLYSGLSYPFLKSTTKI